MRTTLLIGAAFAAAGVTAGQAAFVYQNSTSDLHERFSIGNVEVGDEIILAGTSRILTQFDFQYYGISFSGNEQARVRFYNNDGPLFNSDPKAPTPQTVFYDSGLFNVGPTAGNTLIFTVANGALPANLTLPNRFTWSVQFSGIGTGEDAGVPLFGPPSIGQSENDYWYHDPVQGWQLKTSSTTIMDFAAQVQAVPEPSTMALGLLGGLGGLLFFRRSRKS